MEKHNISNKRMRSWINLAAKIKKNSDASDTEWRLAGIVLALIFHLKEVKKELNKINV